MSEAGYESGLRADMLETWRAIFARQKAFAEHALSLIHI